MKTQAIVVAAGKGLRLKSKTSKALVEISRIPIIILTLKAISQSNLLSSIIVVCRRQDIARINKLVSKFKIAKIKRIVAGGKERHDSVRLGLEAMDRDTDFVLIHDGARPFVDKEIIDSSIKKAFRYKASVAAVSVKPTIKKIKFMNGEVFARETLKRDSLREIQTPQVFKRELIENAYKNFKFGFPTDDASLIEKTKNKVAICPGSYFNIKITTPEDLVFAEAILKTKG